MAINWFPGHMATARKEAVETMGKIDLVIEILDARVAFSSCNPAFEKMRKQTQRPALKVLNKTDAADPEQTRRWLEYYNALPGTKAIALCAKKQSEIKRILTAGQKMLPDRGVPQKPLRMMILGIPNVGKSTVMNALLKRHVANVGDQPAITTMQMYHQLGPGMSLIDTPGMLWPNVSQDAAMKLAATYSISRAAYEDEDVAVELGRTLLIKYPTLLMQRYGDLPDPGDALGLLQIIAKRRVLIKAGQPDIAKASVALLNDFRTGTLGPISLETVDQLTDLRAASESTG